MLFSVGAAGALVGGGAVVVVVVVVVVVDDGAWLPLVPQAAVNAPTAISTAPPATLIRRRSTQRESMYHSCLGSRVDPRSRCFSYQHQNAENTQSDFISIGFLRAGRELL